MRYLTFLLATCSAIAAGTEWAPVDPSELRATSAKVQPGSDAEALFWDVRLTDEVSGDTLQAVLSHYIRIKIYTDRGREKLGTIDLPYVGSDKISDIAGRTISPSGEIAELSKDSIFERDIVKMRGIRLRSKSFALPAVVPGSIVEYRWRETRRNQLSNFVRLQFQREVPVQRVTYHIKPFTNPMFPFAMRTISYQINQPAFQKERDGFYAMTLTNLPAFTEEPNMPAEERVRAWMLIYYAEEEQTRPEKYWPKQSEALYSTSKSQTKPNDAIRQAAAAAVGSETTAEGRLQKLYDYVRREITNINTDPSVTNEKREAFKENKNASDTLKQKAGTGLDIGLLYIAMANALELDVRLVRTAVNDDAVFSRAFTNPYFLRGLVLAAKVPSGWLFFDPMSRYLPFGMLTTNEQGTPGLVGDPKGLDLMMLPASGPERTQTKRTARFKLQEDGTLEGDVTIEYTGYENAWRKTSLARKTAEENVETTKQEQQRRWPHGEISDVAVKNVTDLNAPLTVSYKAKIPGYAERTGRRMFLRPSFFNSHFKPRFTETERRYGVEFDYAWSEVDRVTIELPVGFSLDNATAPQTFSVGQVGEYKAELGYDKKNSVLHYSRDLTFGRNGGLSFPQTAYAPLKKAFELIQGQDDHTVALKQDALRVQ